MTENQQGQDNQRQFALQRIYVKDLSYEAPNAPGIFQQEWKPENNLNLNTQINKLSDEVFEVVLEVTLTTKVGESTAYLVEVQQAAIIALKGFTEQEMGPMLGAYCPNLLFPYAREVISDLIGRGSFPQMLLQPVNFDALFMQHQQEQAKRAQEQPADVKH